MSIPGSSSNFHLPNDYQKYLSPSLTTGVKDEKNILSRINKIISNLIHQLSAQIYRIQNYVGTKDHVWLTNKSLGESFKKDVKVLNASIDKRLRGGDVKKISDNIADMKEVCQRLKEARGVTQKEYKDIENYLNEMEKLIKGEVKSENFIKQGKDGKRDERVIQGKKDLGDVDKGKDPQLNVMSQTLTKEIKDDEVIKKSVAEPADVHTKVTEDYVKQQLKQQGMFEDLKGRVGRLMEELKSKGADTGSIMARAERLMPHHNRLKDSGMIGQEELEIVGNQLNEIREKVGSSDSRDADFVDITEHQETLKEKQLSSANNLNTLLKTMQKATRFGRKHPEAFESFAGSVNDFLSTGKAFDYQEVMEFIKEVLEAEHLVEKNERGELSIVNSDELSVGDYPRLSKDYEKFINSYKAFDDEQEKQYTLAFDLREVLKTLQRSTPFGIQRPEAFNRFLGSVDQFLESEKEYYPQKIFAFIDAILVSQGLAVENENGEIAIVDKEKLPPGDYGQLLNDYENAIKSYKRIAE